MSALFSSSLPLPLVAIGGGAASFILALLVGSLTLRLKGMYFTMFTFGLVELVRNSVHWWEVNITGTVGRIILAADNTAIFYSMVAIFVAVLVVSHWITRSKLGLALQAIGESEEAAAHSGVNVTKVKTVTFAVSAFFMGASGATMSMRWTYIDPRRHSISSSLSCPFSWPSSEERDISMHRLRERRSSLSWKRC